MKKKLLVVMVALMCVLSLAAAPKKAKKAKKSKNKDLNISVFTIQQRDNNHLLITKCTNGLKTILV